MNYLSFPDWLEMKGEIAGVRNTSNKIQKDDKDDRIKISGVKPSGLKESIIRYFEIAKASASKKV
jgi:hypothetical protein